MKNTARPGLFEDLAKKLADSGEFLMVPLYSQDKEDGRLELLATATQRMTSRIMAQVCQEKVWVQDTGMQIAAVVNHELQGVSLKLNPEEGDLPQECLRTLLRYWTGLPRVGGVPNVLKVSPDRFLPALGYVSLIDIEEEGDVLRYALFGSKLAEATGFDLTGQTVWDMPTTIPVQVFCAACNYSAMNLRAPLYAVHKGSPLVSTSYWHRLILPLGADGEVRRLLVGSLPVKQAQMQ